LPIGLIGRTPAFIGGLISIRPGCVSALTPGGNDGIELT